jgi:hypothetical protein
MFRCHAVATGRSSFQSIWDDLFQGDPDEVSLLSSRRMAEARPSTLTAQTVFYPDDTDN